jgi:excinuclease UvrABC nuclease subunit
MEEIDIIDSLKDTKIHFWVNPKLWDEFDEEIYTLVNRNWQEVKFLDDNMERHPQTNELPNNCGGIYIFLAKPNKVPNSHLYLMYIGRAYYSRGQNLKKRCLEYINPERPKIKRLVKGWGKYLYIRYLPIEGNDIIDQIEKELINKILPPFNDFIPDKTIRGAVKAFDL